jgi:thiol-disulfide isomerase/thioredoxin
MARRDANNHARVVEPAGRRRKILAGLLGISLVVGVACLVAGFFPAGMYGPAQALRTAMRGNSTVTMSIAARAASNPTLSAPLKSLIGARQWLNTQPLQAEDLRGKVVVVNFWTYSCINSLRTLPYLKTWADRYKDRGLVIVGAHTPEFGFEKEFGNVEEAVASLGVRYPVALDSDYAIWRAFDNSAWPGFYFIGADGMSRQHRLGEGGYDQSERLIQKLLSEVDGRPLDGALAEVTGIGPQAAADWQDLRSGETYIGYAKADHFVSSGGVPKDSPSLYRIPSMLPLNAWSLAGVWTIGGEFAALDDRSGKIALRFHARDLHLVLALASRARTVRFRVTLDGAPPGASHGFDVDADGRGSVQEPRMYQLIRQRGPVSDRTFEIEFLDPGVQAYVFTFG